MRVSEASEVSEGAGRGSCNPCPGCGGLCSLCERGAARGEHRDISGFCGRFVASTFQLILLSPTPSRPWQEWCGLVFSGGFLTLTVGLFFSVPALQALSTDDSPSNTNLIVQVMFDERAALLSSSSGSRQPGQYQVPSKRKPPGDQKRPAGAPGTTDAGRT